MAKVVYSKMVQAEPRFIFNADGDLIPIFALPENEGLFNCWYGNWNEYKDGSLKVKIVYSGEISFKPWARFSVWGADDTGVEIFQLVENDKEFNKLLSKWLEIYHEMPKHLTMQWCYDHGFVNA